MSLNKVLLTGSYLLNNLIGILLRFRNRKVTIDAGIETMYNQLQVPQHDANLLGFFWQDDINDGNPENYQMVVHFFGGKDAQCLANYALKRTGRDNLENLES